MHSIIYNCLKMETNFHQKQNKLWSINYCTAMKINLLINKLGLNHIKLERPESICINFINRKKCQNVFFDGKNVRQKSQYQKTWEGNSPADKESRGSGNVLIFDRGD